MPQLPHYLLIASISLLTACGGGGSSNKKAESDSPDNSRITPPATSPSTPNPPITPSVPTPPVNPSPVESTPVKPALTIKPPERNQAPSLNPIGSKTVISGETETINLSATDKENDPLSFSGRLTNGNALPDFISISRNGVLKISPNTSESANEYQLSITVTDSSNNSDNETVSIKIVPNQAPQLATIESLNSYLGANDKVITLSAQDEENHALTFSAKLKNGEQLPGFIDITTNAAKTEGTLIVKGESAQVGSYTVKILVTDELGAQDSETLAINIEKGLKLNPISNLILNEGDNLTTELSALNLGSEAVHYSVTLNDGSPTPDFIYIDNNQLIIGNNAYADEFYVSVSVQKENSRVGSIQDSQSIKITVNPVIVQRAMQILPLGDSITQASSDSLSYRYPLWKSLINEGKPFNFTGSETQTFGDSRDWPEYNGHAFDQDHEGHVGWTTKDVLDSLDGWLSNYEHPVDIALIHLGTNDLINADDDASTIQHTIEQIINQLRTHNPDTKILLAKIIPYRFEWSSASSKYLSFNSGLDELANNLSQENSPVIIVDMASDFNVDSQTDDGVHPNESGEEIIAQRWFDALINNELL